jgi:hypothetical protein
MFLRGVLEKCDVLVVVFVVTNVVDCGRNVVG